MGCQFRVVFTRWENPRFRGGIFDETVKLWDVATRTNIATLEGHTWAVYSVSFSPDGTLLASGSSDRTVKLWDVATRTNIATLAGHRDQVNSVSFSPDGTTLASGSTDDTIKLWVAIKQNIATLQGHTSNVYSVSFSPDGTLLASGSYDDTVKLWDVATDTNIATLEGHTDTVESVSFSPDGTTLASGSDDGTVKLWDVATRTNIATLQGHTDWVTSVSFSPDGKTLASGSWNHTVKLWDVGTKENIATLEHTDSVYSVSFSPDGTLLASGSTDGTVKLWDMPPYIIKRTDVRGPRVTKTNVTDGGKDINPEGLSRDGIIIEFDEDIAYSSLRLTYEDGTDLGWLSTLKDNKVTLTPIAGKKLGHETSYVLQGVVRDGMGNKTDVTLRFVTSIRTDAIGPSFTEMSNVTDGEWDIDPEVLNRDGIIIEFDEDIAWSSLKLTYGGGTDLGWLPEVKDNKVILVPIAGKKLFYETEYFVEGTVRDRGGNETDVQLTFVTLVFPITDTYSVSFSPDGKTLASGSDDGTVKLWDVATRQNIAILRHTGNVTSVSFSPDGTTLASTGDSFFDRTVKLWDVATGTNIATLEHPHGVVFVSFSPDGTLLASVGRIFDETVKLWDMSPYITPITLPESLIGDVNQDGVVNIQDLVLVASNLGKTGQNAADVNGDGIVNIQDLVLVAGALGSSAAAPSLNSESLSTLTAADVKSWLTQARQLNLTDATSQRGILFLEQLLVVLTPKETALLHNYPNPFNPETWIPYDLAKDADVSLHIYAVNGQVVRTLSLGHQASGRYQSRSRAAYWDGKNEFGEKVASGLYFYTLTAGDFSATRKMLIRK